MMANILITICARGGSKGLPNKNIKLFRGRPLISWTLDQALNWGKSDVVVSTDSLAIIRIVKSYPQIVILKRPQELAGDGVPKLDAIRHALKAMEKAKKAEYQTVIDLDVTNCHRKVQDIQNCYKLFSKNKPDTFFSVVKARRNPYFNQIMLLDGKVKLCKSPQKKIFCRQDAPEIFDLNNCIYVYARNWLVDEANKSPITENSGIYIMPDHTAFDTDDLLSFYVSEFLMKKYMR